jgi:flagellar assembly protein FliH
MAAQDTNAWDEVQVLQYPACPVAPSQPAWNGWVEADEGNAEGSAHERSRGGHDCGTGGASGEEAQEESRQSYEAGRERGQQEGRQAEREAQAARLVAEDGRRKQQLAALVARFSEEKDHFLHAVEQEVVKLALAVAARILRREAQMDPLLLTGAVRVALGQLAASSEVRLQVPERDSALWTETVALLPHLAMKPIVVPVEGMRLGDCVIESKAGSVDLGVRSQLGEIERGFFDRSNTAATRTANIDARTNDSMPQTANDAVQS